MRTVKTFLKNSLANYAQKIIRTCVGIVTIGVIARYLTPELFGRYAYILAFLTIAEVTSGMGVPMILCREIAKNKERAPTLIAAGLLLQSSLCVVTLTVLGVAFYLVSPSAGIFLAVSLCAVAEIFKFLERFFWSVYQGFEKMGYGTLQTTLTQGLRLILTLIAVKNDLGLQGIFGAMLVGHLGGTVFGYVAVSRLFARPQFRGSMSLTKYFFRESYPLAIRGVFRKFNHRASTLILAAVRTSYDVGMFNSAHKIILNLLFVSEASSQAIFPILSRFSSTSKTSLDKAYQTGLKIALLIGLPLAILLSRFSEVLIELVFGRAYLESATLLSLLAWALVPLFLNGFTQRVLVAGNKQSLTSMAMAGGLLVNVILNLIFIPRMGYLGAGIATLSGEILPFCLNLFFVTRFLGVHVAFLPLLKPVAAALATYGVLAALPSVNVFLGCLVGIIVYSATLFLMRAFSDEEVSVVRELFKGRKLAKPTGA